MPVSKSASRDGGKSAGRFSDCQQICQSGNLKDLCILLPASLTRKSFTKLAEISAGRNGGESAGRNGGVFLPADSPPPFLPAEISASFEQLFLVKQESE